MKSGPNEVALLGQEWEMSLVLEQSPPENDRHLSALSDHSA